MTVRLASIVECRPGCVLAVLLACAVSLAPSTAPARDGGPSADVEALVITGAAPYGYHPWEASVERLRPRLEAFGFDRIDYYVARGLEDWRKWDGVFEDYDVIVLIYYWSQAPPTDLERLDAHVRDGGGLVVVHSALAGFWRQETFDEWTGIAYRERAEDYGVSLVLDEEGERTVRPPGEGPGSGHLPIRPFRIRTRVPDHPITRGLPPVWMQSEDELYHDLRGPHAKIEVLADAEARDGEYHPQAWVRRHGEGRIFCLTPGHHPPAASSVGFVTLLARGMEWSGTGSVTLPVPSNFPGPDEPVTEMPRFEGGAGSPVE